MNNNISLADVRKSLKGVSKYFDPEKEAYKIITNCSENQMTTRELIENLNKDLKEQR